MCNVVKGLLNVLHVFDESIPLVSVIARLIELVVVTIINIYQNTKCLNCQLEI